jgi:sulfotransferase|tara:strand:+ start:1366 stop:2118 length:753 start_codon:yes stop_codon:yes gene_type:complete
MKENKQFNFFCGLPRAGNTLLSSILNQNPDVAVGANSLVPEIFLQLRNLYNTEVFKNFPDALSLNNIIHNVLPCYYHHWTAKYILDRGTWGTQDSLYLLKSLQPYLNTPLKFVVLVRPVLDILASFMRIEKPNDVEARCHELMKEDGMVGKAWLSYKNLLKEDSLIIHYDHFVANPQKTIDKIYTFLNIPSFNHSFINLDQFRINEIMYDDGVIGSPLHQIRTDKILKHIHKLDFYLPKCIIDKYNNWKL